MYETVKTVKGYDITRMKGTKGAYHVNVREGKGFKIGRASCRERV